jgi:hypothetical protein
MSAEANVFCTACGCEMTTTERFCAKCGGVMPMVAMTQARVKCPFCAEEIQPAARKCKFWGEFVDAALNASGARHTPVIGVSPYYEDEFRKIEASGGNYKGRWNWAAFYFGALWALTKGLWLPAVICIVGALLSGGIVGIVYWFIFGARGNYMLYCKLVKRQDIAI